MAINKLEFIKDESLRPSDLVRLFSLQKQVNEILVRCGLGLSIVNRMFNSCLEGEICHRQGASMGWGKPERTFDQFFIDSRIPISLKERKKIDTLVKEIREILGY